MLKLYVMQFYVLSWFLVYLLLLLIRFRVLSAVIPVIRGVVQIVNSLGNLVINILSVIFGIGYSQQNFFNHGLPNFINFCSPYIAQFKIYLSDLMFFVPKSVLIVCLSVLLAVTLIRIVAAIVNFVWW